WRQLEARRLPKRCSYLGPDRSVVAPELKRIRSRAPSAFFLCWRGCMRAVVCVADVTCDGPDLTSHALLSGEVRTLSGVLGHSLPPGLPVIQAQAREAPLI